MMVLLLMLASSSPPPPVESAARRVIEAQLKAPAREEAELSAEEAARIRQLYLESIGRQVERAPEAR
ncbi:hypothetical protein HHL26_17600 [Sphingobium sp. TB-6]|uniref:hypothetical protein n=1 Tax=Sphingobium sp. TB-6 TaxID=2728850 RepID=UPI001469BD8F|nr:hypothetical protein [Sphingobium sp. TB-6]NML90865.1 hypothetical protein [Sphingobium sp. TB-6]